MSWNSDFTNAPKDRPIVIFDGNMYLCKWNENENFWEDINEDIPIYSAIMWFDVDKLPDGYTIR